MKRFLKGIKKQRLSSISTGLSEDPGAVVNFSENTKQISYIGTTALLVKKELEAMGAKVILTEQATLLFHLLNVLKLVIKIMQMHLFSIHFDSSEDDNASGTTAYYYGDRAENTVRQLAVFALKPTIEKPRKQIPKLHGSS